MIHLISLFTIFLVIFGSSVTIINVKNTLNKNLNYCISTTSDFNLKRRAALDKLFAQNSKARALRKKREIAEQAYRIAPAQAKAFAYAALQAVKLSQKILRIYQQKIIYTLKLLLTKFKVEAIANKYSVLKLSNRSLIQSYPKDSDSPSYRVVTNFSKISKVLIRKKFNLNKGFPIFFKNLLNSKKGQIECGSNMNTSVNQKIQLKLLGGKSF